MVLTSSLGCANKTTTNIDPYETKVHKVQYQPIDCGEFKLKGLSIQNEDLTEHPGSLKNQKIVTHNLIILDYKLKEAESLLNCYKLQNQKLIESQN